MKVILSIKPEFAFKIFDGKKKYEYRRAIFKNREIKKIIVYASSPVKKVIGEFEIDHIINKDIEELWEKTRDHSGISSNYYYEYFKDKEYGYAIAVKKTRRYKQPLNLFDAFGVNPPQSFAYVL